MTVILLLNKASLTTLWKVLKRLDFRVWTPTKQVQVAKLHFFSPINCQIQTRKVYSKNSHSLYAYIWPSLFCWVMKVYSSCICPFSNRTFLSISVLFSIMHFTKYLHSLRVLSTLRAKSSTSQLWLKLNCRLKVNCNFFFHNFTCNLS